ncbi:MAG: ABC transporter substrate-binding protein [Candidatus Binatia bacterium]
MKKLLMIGYTVISLVVYGLTTATAEGGAPKELIEGAKKEGILYWYTSMGVHDHSKYVALFNKKYPFIKVKVRRASGARLISLIQTEHRAGKHLFDVAMGSRFGPSFIRSGIFGKYLSPERKHLAQGTKDPEGYWADAYVNGVGVTYNTEMVPPDKVPQRWEDLLKPMWKGKIAKDPREIAWYDAVPRVMGPEKGRSFLKKLGQQNLQFRTGFTLKANGLTAGEFPLCLCYVHQIDRVKKNRCTGGLGEEPGTICGKQTPSDLDLCSGPAPECGEALYRLCTVKRRAAAHGQIGEGRLLPS